MKKFFFLTLVLIMITPLMLFTACGSDDKPTDTTKADTTKAPATTAAETIQKAPATTATTTTQAPVITPPLEDLITKDENSVSVTSLNGELTIALKKTDAGKIVYTLTAKDGTVLIGESAMGLTTGSYDVFENASFKDATAKVLNVSYKHLGTFSELIDHSVAATVTMQNGDYEFAVEIKLYDNGVAFRYNLPKGNGKTTIIKGEATSFAVQNIGKVWYGANSDCYEDSIKSALYSNISTSDKLTGPLMIELAEKKGYVSLLEGYVEPTYIGTNFVSTGKDNTFKVTGSWTKNKDFDSFTATGDIVTGWRIINYSADLGDIVTNNNIYHTALGMDGKTTSYTDTDWITPGKSVWSWLSETGVRVEFESQINYTINAAKLGFSYNIIDDGYIKWEDYEDKLLYLGLTGEEVGVKQILWGAVTNQNGWQITNKTNAKTIMQKIANLHLSGIKLDFFNAETNTLTHDIQVATLEEGMALHLVVNFHGVHKPTAYSVLYPNELTREAIRGLECLSKSDYATQANYIVAQYYTRLLSGHADFTPDARNAMQIASLIVLDSPMMVLAANTNEMLTNPALEMIRAIPTVWDQTVFLDGTVGKYVSLAKEKDGVWYVGGITTSNKTVEVDLSKILGEGEYLLTGWVDETTTKKTQITQTVTKDTKLDLGTIKKSCGYVFQITKLSISQHGGEITGPITVKTASNTAVVKYTLDGSDPMTSETATVAGETITITESALLRIAIVEGDGKGTALSYQFNKINYNGITNSIVTGDGITTVTLAPTVEGAKLYYTIDGTTPTTASAEYTAPIVFEKSATLKVIAVTPNSKISPAKPYTVSVTATVHSITPDTYIGSDYTEAGTDWGNIRVNQSMNDTTLSLGGISETSGTKFEHGISANANAHFVYNIPANATKFVGVAGIDDSNYRNTYEGYKASTIVKVYVDGALMYTTQKLGCGQFEQIEVAIPAGATTLRIEFGDAGDGITCDNVDLCDAGFILAK